MVSVTRVETPVVIGTSVLTPAGKAKITAPKSNATPIQTSTPSISKALEQLLGGTAPSAAQPSTAIANMLASTKSGSLADPTNSSPITPTATIAERGIDAKSPVAGGFSPMQFAAALALARQQLGGPHLGSFSGELSAAQQMADTQRHQAIHHGKQAETDDAILYGHLGNYIDQLTRGGDLVDNKAERGTTSNFNSALSAIRNSNSGTEAEVRATDQARGIAPAPGLSQAKTDQAFQTAQARNNKSDAVSQLVAGNSVYHHLMNQTRGDVAVTGTGKVADEKEALNTTLSNIASALAAQAAQINSAKGAAQDSYQTQLHGLAAQLSGQSAALNPNLPQNQLIQSEIAKNIASAEHTSGTAGPGQPPVVAPTISGKKGIAQAENYLASLTQQNAGVPSAHTGTLESIFHALLNSQGNYADPYNPNNYATDLQGLRQAVANRKGQGYGQSDLNALESALNIILGKE